MEATEASKSDSPLIEPHIKGNGASTRKILKYNSYRSIHEPMEATEASKSDPPLIEPHIKGNGASTRTILNYNSYWRIHDLWKLRKLGRLLNPTPLSSSLILREMVLLLGKY